MKRHKLLFPMALVTALLFTGCGTQANSVSQGTQTTQNRMNSTKPATNPDKTKQNSSTAQWSPVIQEAMNSVRGHTSIPLVAPTFILQSHNSNFPSYVSAITKSKKSGYSVQLFVTTSKLSVNDPAIQEPPNGGLASVLSSFGATETTSASVALSDVNHSSSPYSAYSFQIPTDAQSRTVDLGNGIIGQEYNQQSVIQWHEGKWTCKIVSAPVNQEIEEAKTIVAYLNKYLLPETNGGLTVVAAPDGQHTTLKWAIGNTVYQAGDYHNALTAIKVAMSMRDYPSGSSKGVQYSNTIQSKSQVNVSLNRAVIPRGLATSIPKNAYYLKVEFIDKNKNQVGVWIGHELTTQGAGIQDHGPVFYRTGNHVTVYIPLGVVFETEPNSDLFAYFPKEKKPIPTNPTSVWLLMYGGTVNNYIMTSGSLTVKDLESWAISSNNAQDALNHNVMQAEKDGWKIEQTVNMQHNLTGYLGHNGWAKIPIGVPVNLVETDGNDIFEIQGIVSQTQLLKEHPELKAGIEAASAPAR